MIPETIKYNERNHLDIRYLKINFDVLPLQSNFFLYLLFNYKQGQGSLLVAKQVGIIHKIKTCKH